MDEHRKEFREFAEKAHDVLIKVKGVWPFDMFPDEATLDRQMFTIRRNVFVGVAKVITSHHDDILNSNVQIGPFFGSVTVHLKYITEGEVTMNWLSKKDAKRLHAMLQGLLSATKNNLDLSSLENAELRKRLIEMGNTI